MTAPTVFLYNSSAAFGNNYVYLSGGKRAVPWNGTDASPWNDASTTPFEIANNDVTGAPFVVSAPGREPILTGTAPFAAWADTLGYAFANRTITIPIQGRALNQDDLPRLLAAIRRVIYDTIAFSPLYLVILQGNAYTSWVVEGGVLQETPAFWNDELGRGLIRAVLTLDGRIGTGEFTEISPGTTITNAVADTSLFAGVTAGDWQRLGQPLMIGLSGGDIAVAGTKTIYCAVCENVATSSVLSESLATSSTSGVASTAGRTGSTGSARRTRQRMLVEITSPSSNLEIRARVTYYEASGAMVYRPSEWMRPGTSTTIVDLGGFSPSVRLETPIYGRIEYRSTNGAATSGTLRRIHILDYHTFCKIVPPQATDTGNSLWIASAFPGSFGGFSSGVRRSWPAYAAVMAGAPTQFAPIIGSPPVAVRDARLFLAWSTGGVFDPTDQISVWAYYLSLFESIAGEA